MIINNSKRFEEVRNYDNHEYALYQLEGLYRLRDKWKDDIPKEIIHSTSPDNFYKVRQAFFGILRMKIDGLVGRGIIDDKFKEEYDLFVINLRARLEKNNGLTKRQDISKANNFIHRAIRQLENIVC